MRRSYFLMGFLLLAVVLIVTFIAYPYLPARVPSHWNTRGQVDAYSGKWILLALNPGMMVFFLALFGFLEWLSPRHWGVQSFRSTYLYIMLVMLAFPVYIQGLLLWAALKGPWDIGRAVTAGVALLIALLGNVMGKLQRNFYIGVRTPWTLASERVWIATHRLAGKTFVAGGIAGLVLSLAGAGVWPFLAVIMAAALVPVAYSLVYYKRLERRGEV